MTSEICLYIEGGGDKKATRIRLRTAFAKFLNELRDLARRRTIGFDPRVFGSGASTFRAFNTALHTKPRAFNVLLVDAEGPVTSSSPWEHLRTRPQDRWENPGMHEKHCHLMVQTMEAWLIADREKLREYYGRNFYEKALPDNPNVEEIEKDTLLKALNHATRHAKKGKYHKTKHAPEILQCIRSSEVRRKASFCDRLFSTLIAEIDAA